MVSDAAGRIVYVNPRGEQITGYSPDEFVGRRIVALFPDDGQDADSIIRHADAAMYEAKRGTGVASCRA